jgi:hypothetical protein
VPYTYDPETQRAILQFPKEGFHLGAGKWLGIFKPDATMANFLSIMYNYDGEDPSGVFHILGMHSGEIFESDIGSWLQTEFDYRLDGEPVLKNVYYGDKNNEPQLLDKNPNQPAFNNVALQSLMDATSGFSANSAYFVGNTNTTITFPDPLPVFTFINISGSSKFISNGETVEVWFKNELLATVQPGGSYTLKGHCAFMGLTGYTGDLSGVLWTSPEIVKDPAILAAEIDNMNADLRAQMEINRGLLAKKAEVVKFGEQTLSSIEGVVDAPEVDAAIVHIDPHDLGVFDTLPTPVPQDAAYQCGYPNNEAPGLFKPEQVQGYSSASPVTAYIEQSFDYSLATPIDRVQFAPAIDLSQEYSLNPNFMRYKIISLFPTRLGENYDTYLYLQFLEDCSIEIYYMGDGSEWCIGGGVYINEGDGKMTRNPNAWSDGDCPLGSYDPATGILTFTEPMYWALSARDINECYQWMQKHQQGGGYAEKYGTTWQWMLQGIPYAPLATVTGVDRSGYLSWLKYKNILQRLDALEA